MKKESDISNTVLQSASSSVIIESNEESSKPQSMKYKKRFFSSISYYKSSLNFEFNVKQYKPFSAKQKACCGRHHIFIPTYRNLFKLSAELINLIQNNIHIY